MMCFPFFHKWGKYEAPKVIDSATDGPTVAQRKVCQRCGAVSYRRVLVQNG